MRHGLWLVLLAALVFLLGCLTIDPPTGHIVLQSRWMNEKVTCEFQNSLTKQSCASKLGSCEGMGSCTVAVNALGNTVASWRGSCSGVPLTIVDGRNETARFQCGGSVTETVRCAFVGSQALNSCFSDKGRCSGIGACAVEVVGNPREAVQWTSSCGGARQTVINHRNEFLEFVCSGDVREQVQCVFLGSRAEEECRASSGRGSCKGVGSCTLTVRGAKGERLAWRSQCGGYDYTKFNGKNKSVYFRC